MFRRAHTQERSRNTCDHHHHHLCSNTHHKHIKPLLLLPKCRARLTVCFAGDKRAKWVHTRTHVRQRSSGRAHSLACGLLFASRYTGWSLCCVNISHTRRERERKATKHTATQPCAQSLLHCHHRRRATTRLRLLANRARARIRRKEFECSVSVCNKERARV